MQNHVRGNHKTGKGSFLAIAFSAAIAVMLLLNAAAPLSSQSASDQTPSAQPQAPAAGRPKFEVVSIKPNNSGGPGVRLMLPAGRFTATNVTPKLVIASGPRQAL